MRRIQRTERLNEEGSEETSNIFKTSNIGVGRENDSQLYSPGISQNEAIQEKEKEKNYSENNKSSGVFEYRWPTNPITDLVHPSLFLNEAKIENYPWPISLISTR